MYTIYPSRDLEYDERWIMNGKEQLGVKISSPVVPTADSRVQAKLLDQVEF
jgi:hypothetical protein